MNAYLLLSIASSIAPEQEILTFFNQRQNYEQLAQRVGALASRLAADGVGHGDKVGIISTNSPEVVESFFAAF